MSGIRNLSRRDFLKNTGVTGAMVLGAQVAPGSLIAGGRGHSRRAPRYGPTSSSPSPATGW